MAGDKRKADVFGKNHTLGRADAKRAATFSSVGEFAHDSALSTNPMTRGQYHIDHSRTQLQTITPAKSPQKQNVTISDVDMEMVDSDAACIETFRHSLNDFYQYHNHLFGPAHQTDLKNAYHDILLDSSPARVLSAGEAFVAKLHGYVQDLQQAAIQQIRWRASTGSLGASREVLAATDAVLSQLDAQIIGIGAEAERLMQEVGMLRDQYQSPALHTVTSML
ncbi:hypothetical protein CLAFUW4_04769 [Fulvia fulva]|uniref:Uncharacterized protein n=1 Tax=Passalora fulva TaxID=5499 RepID=A0A9Q8PHU8_PASFU|nr:uncharacterized protein CLAFUR5_12131 [Fulvia fulva]KAK4626813.1 hypothetical protein CLAFUR4_04755 [Fulvia fulva]KAK4628213.1 hypothetical protein CLAFUR0_04759 [Fulvia fulva]UJO22728.1 hypothetical protein CLAFUR5_12131 [Fulvia fulva]WPV13829.1 hypothetical protein CLAFUW4_04769 [Fulvia fulva]WPV28073.1 hypothetical protein CLAFUW7_04763 [Fulvia fulva]